MELNHPNHPHPLQMKEEEAGSFVVCNACKYSCVGPSYSCEDCGFHLHESCAQLPQEVENYSLHPHRLTLKTDHIFRCHTCGSLPRQGSCFSCDADNCGVVFDVYCTFMRPVGIEEGEEQRGTLDFSHHPHPLVWIEKFPKNHITCRVCGRYCSDPSSYGCLICQFFCHPKCLELKLQQKIQHFFHPCLLTLNTGPKHNFCCGACELVWPAGTFYYGCEGCDFYMDINCILLPSMEAENSSEEQICNILHGHPLSLLKIPEGKKQIHCSVCGKACTRTDPTYACDRSFCQTKAFIHKSCLQFPLEICHPFHPYHPLTLRQLDFGEKCNACRKLIPPAFGRVYQSFDYTFLLHLECSKIRTAIASDGHSHLIQFKDNVGDDQKMECSDCRSPCESYAFSCLGCDYDSDLKCGPLPHQIKHDFHLHPLLLMSDLSEFEELIDEDFYCDICEQKRDPLLRNYQCTECQFVAEIACVISEVIS